MSLKKLLKNIKYLSKNILIPLHEQQEIVINNLIEQVLYEIPMCEMPRPRIMNYEETVNKLLNSNYSVARFGDGEIQIINGNDIPFQKYDSKLAEQLKNILQSDIQNLMVCINYEYYYPKIDKLIPKVQLFYRHSVSGLRKNLSGLINWNKQYFAAAFTQLYLFFNEYNFEKHYADLKQIWDDKKILIVTCKEALNAITHNIYDNAVEIDYLYIPSHNAYSEYDDIYNKIKKYSNDTLIILMAGPTAKVLANDLTQENYRCLDMGHLMKDYDWYKKSIVRSNENVIKFMSPD